MEEQILVSVFVPLPHDTLHGEGSQGVHCSLELLSSLEMSIPKGKIGQQFPRDIDKVDATGVGLDRGCLWSKFWLNLWLPIIRKFFNVHSIIPCGLFLCLLVAFNENF